MNISIGTATLYYLPFNETLEIITEAGFDSIELDIYWKGVENWQIAQHLEDISPKDALRMVWSSGLRISCIHDGGGTIEEDTQSAINPSLFEYLKYFDGSPQCLIFHPPHKRTNQGLAWWREYQGKYVEDLSRCSEFGLVCIENLPHLEGYYVPLTDPKDLWDFAELNGFSINVDTTHLAQNDVDICSALEILKKRVKSVHLSDYRNGESHVFPGEGNLDLRGFIRKLENVSLSCFVLECTIDKSHQLPKKEVIRQLRATREYLIQLANNG